MKKSILGLTSGIVIAYAVTAIVFILTAILITYTSLQESAVPAIVMAACVLSVILAGFDASRKANERGWLWGMAAGAAYAVIFIIIMTISRGAFVLDARKLMLVGLSLVGGAIGGMIGINFKRK